MANFFNRLDEKISNNLTANGVTPERQDALKKSRKNNRFILIIAILVAVFVSYYMTATSGIETMGVVEDGVGTFYVNVIDINKIGTGLDVKIIDEDAEIVAIGDKIEESVIAELYPEDQLRRAIGVTKFNYEVTLDCQGMEDGLYPIIVPSVKESAEKIKAEQAAAQ